MVVQQQPTGSSLSSDPGASAAAGQSHLNTGDSRGSSLRGLATSTMEAMAAPSSVTAIDLGKIERALIGVFTDNREQLRNLNNLSDAEVKILKDKIRAACAGLPCANVDFRITVPPEKFGQELYIVHTPDRFWRDPNIFTVRLHGTPGVEWESSWARTPGHEASMAMPQVSRVATRFGEVDPQFGGKNALGIAQYSIHVGKGLAPIKFSNPPETSKLGPITDIRFSEPQYRHGFNVVTFQTMCGDTVCDQGEIFFNQRGQGAKYTFSMQNGNPHPAPAREVNSVIDLKEVLRGIPNDIPSSTFKSLLLALDRDELLMLVKGNVIFNHGWADQLRNMGDAAAREVTMHHFGNRIIAKADALAEGLRGNKSDKVMEILRATSPVELEQVDAAFSLLHGREKWLTDTQKDNETGLPSLSLALPRIKSRYHAEAFDLLRSAQAELGIRTQEALTGKPYDRSTIGQSMISRASAE